ncbi:MAG: sulfite exporter TauE/SafE family protein [Paludibacteraceae bacterium]
MDVSEILNLSASPWWITFLLAVVFALDPCAILTNIAVIGFIGRDLENHKRVFINGLWYTLGRTLAFGVLGAVLMLLLRGGADILHLQDLFAEYGELLLAPFLILMGVLMFVADLLPTVGRNRLADKVEGRIKSNAAGALLLGAVLSLAFCPTNAALFFGMVAQPHIAVWHILFFALIVALPVLIIAWILAFSFDSISRFYDKIRRVGKWFRWSVGVLFIGLGLFFLFEHLLE